MNSFSCFKRPRILRTISRSFVYGIFGNLLLISIGVAQEEGGSTSLDSQTTSPHKSGFGVVGENIDLRTGALNWEIQDARLPGAAGMDLNVFRSWNKSTSLSHRAFANWELEIPRIELTGPPDSLSEGNWGANGTKRDYCSAPKIGSSRNLEGPRFEECSIIDWGGVEEEVCELISEDVPVDWHEGVKLYVPGQGLKRFLRRYENSESNSSAEYTTTDNWLLDCDDPVDQNEQERFIVTSPDGMRYTLDVYGYDDASEYVNLSTGRAPSELPYSGYKNTVTVYASVVTDRFGNSINYNYQHHISNEGRWGGEIDQPLLQSLSSADAQINFEYTNHATPYVDKMIINGEEWAYIYSNDGNYLSEVVLPDGSSWNYDYQGLPYSIFSPSFFNSDNLKNRNYLSSIINPQGLEISYSYQEQQNYFGVIGEFIPGKDFVTFNESVPNYSIHFPRYLLITPNIINSWSTITLPIFPSTVLTNRTSNSSDVTATTMGFDYSRENDKNITTISGDHNEKYMFSTNAYLLGTLERKETLDTLDNILETVSYTWLRQDVLGEDGMDDYRLPESQSGEGRTVVTQTITKRPVSYPNVEFITQYLNYDELGNPQTIKETGTRKRRRDVTYLNKTNYDASGEWIIGLPENSLFFDNTDDQNPVLLGSISQTFDSKGLLASVNNFGISQDFEYYSTGELKKSKYKQDTSSPFIEIEYQNYKMGIPQLELYPENINIVKIVDNFGRVTSETDADGHTRSYQYDALGRVSSVQIPGEAEEVILWESPKIQKISKGNYRETNTYDSMGRMLSSEKYDIYKSANKIYTNAVYDKFGRTIFTSFPSADPNETNGIASTYDVLGRIKTNTDTSIGATSSYYYGEEWSSLSLAGDPTQFDLGFGVIDGRGYKKVYEQEAYGDPGATYPIKIHEQITRFSSVENTPNKYVTTNITQDALGNRRSVSQGGYTRTYSYYTDRPLLLSSISQPETGITTFTYDDFGNTKTEKTGSGGITTFEYDALNRINRIDYPAGTDDVDIDYYPSGKLKTLNNGLTTWSYGYNPAGKLTIESLSIVGDQFDLNYNYNLLGDRSSMTYPNGETVGYNPDGFGRAQQVGNYASDINYHPDGFIASFDYRNGHTTHIEQNNKGLIQEIRSGIGSDYSMQQMYSYDENNNVSSQVDMLVTANSKYLTYDGLDRLKTANSGSWGGVQLFDYDDVGNILNKTIGSSVVTYNYNSATNQLASVSGGYNFNYDAHGNVTDNGKNSFIFDSANRLTSVNGTPSIEYIYDGHGHRVAVAKSNSSQDVDFIAVYNREGKLVHRKDTITGDTTNYFYLGHRLAATNLDCSSSDSDSDGIPNCVEDAWGLDKNSSGDAEGDLDGDGLLNIYEYAFDLNAKKADTDGNGLSDLYEVQNNFEGNYSGDTDGDGLSNHQEFLAGANPLNSDTDGDGTLDGSDSNPTLNEAVLIAILSTLLN